MSDILVNEGVVLTCFLLILFLALKNPFRALKGVLVGFYYAVLAGIMVAYFSNSFSIGLLFTVVSSIIITVLGIISGDFDNSSSPPK